MSHIAGSVMVGVRAALALKSHARDVAVDDHLVAILGFIREQELAVGDRARSSEVAEALGLDVDTAGNEVKLLIDEGYANGIDASSVGGPEYLELNLTLAGREVVADSTALVPVPIPLVIEATVRVEVGQRLEELISGLEAARSDLEASDSYDDLVAHASAAAALSRAEVPDPSAFFRLCFKVDRLAEDAMRRAQEVADSAGAGRLSRLGSIVGLGKAVIDALVEG